MSGDGSIHSTKPEITGSDGDEELVRFERVQRKPRMLRFDDLVGERDTFETADGRTIEFRHPREFDAVDAAKLDKMQKDFDAALKKLQDDFSDVEAAETVDRIGEELLCFILPDIDETTLGRLKTGARVQIVEWWARETQFTAGMISGEAQAHEVDS